MSTLRRAYDVAIVGGGHNALVAAAYLARGGLSTIVFERRELVGGAAVTEELVPGFKFSRASYLAGLLRPQIIEDLQLERHGFKYLARNPSSFTPSPANGGVYHGRSLMLGSDASETHKSIAQFSRADADAFAEYEDFLGRVREVVSPLLDGAPPEPFKGRWPEQLRTVKRISSVARQAHRHADVLAPLYELFTSPADRILNHWFESDILKTTLATDAVIGAMTAPSLPGSAYVLLHHVMGEAAGQKGVWAYVEGGMGAVSDAIASAARQAGATIELSAPVSRVLTSADDASVAGVRLEDGREFDAKTVVVGCGLHHAIEHLVPQSSLPPSFIKKVRQIDHSCGSFKINCAIDRLPRFPCLPFRSDSDSVAGPEHRGTIHFENHMADLERAYAEARTGHPAARPVVEMTIPSAIDTTLAPPGKHVAQLFVQYAPFHLAPGLSWADDAFKRDFVYRVFRLVDQFAPGFSSSILAYDALSPLDLQTIFGLEGGSITHGALSLNQLGYARPVPGHSDYRLPLTGLYLASASAHPGGGVMGAPGRNAAQVILSDVCGK